MVIPPETNIDGSTMLNLNLARMNYGSPSFRQNQQISQGHLSSHLEQASQLSQRGLEISKLG